MLVIPRWKLWTILGICFFGMVFAMPNLLSPERLQTMPSWLKNTVNLGLELRGGSYLQLEVDLKEVAKEYLSNLLDETRLNLRKQQIGYTNLVVESKGTASPSLTFLLRNPDDAEQATKVLRAIDSGLTVSVENAKVTAILSEQMLEHRNRSIIEQSIEVVRRRVDESGTKEPIIQRQGADRIVVQLPGIEDPAEVKKLIGRTAKMTFRLVDSATPPVVGAPGSMPYKSAPLGTEYLEEVSHEGQVRYLAVKKQVMVSGESLIDAQATFSHTGQPAVSLKFNSVGARKFADMSAQNIKKQFAIVLDDKIISAPVFQDIIPDGNGQISGHFTVKEANELSLLLRAGALPAPLKVIEERTVGPSLGADSIHDGKIGTVVAFILVSIFMFLCYGTFGFFADIALIFNLILLFAGLSLLQATLTLPGIAGIALTIGMAVDANVLIYERIKEEIRAGIRPLAAVDAGYKRAVTTIIDSNLTTLIGAAVLFEFGTGPIRGFAVTLALGILISLFTALSLTRLIIVLWARRQKVLALPL
ncbi:protein translocase subunit SecD [Candidatus Finniella inopinata]|uniref:Protein translocase subunit SecD n=1 Tax=Candidatus Finniella inopinata TaxID=1696036 RepID=A0A4Q7DHU4_9PROT|nr:protein translocase subunit SecD [Candidatus Finniella inopinata]RZI45504.1 protein translocase subunit SecD [Candidatus Finniella inopinata]